MCAPQPLSSLSPYTTLFRSKYMQNSSLKIFALAVCGYALFLLSANIYQATFSVRKGLCLKSLISIVHGCDKAGSSASAWGCVALRKHEYFEDFRPQTV